MNDKTCKCVLTGDSVAEIWNLRPNKAGYYKTEDEERTKFNNDDRIAFMRSNYDVFTAAMYQCQITYKDANITTYDNVLMVDFCMDPSTETTPHIVLSTLKTDEKRLWIPWCDIRSIILVPKDVDICSYVDVDNVDKELSD